LSQGETFVLDQIRDMYGAQNNEEAVFFSDADEAAIFVTDRNGVQGLLAVLTNLAAMYADGSIGSAEELRAKWLTPPEGALMHPRIAGRGE
jgi:hypothetical protein